MVQAFPPLKHLPRGWKVLLTSTRAERQGLEFWGHKGLKASPCLALGSESEQYYAKDQLVSK